MPVSISTLHQAQPFTQEYIEALAEYQDKGHELPEYVLVTVQTKQVQRYTALELPFSRVADAFWLNIDEFISDFKYYKSDPESQEDAFYYTHSSRINRKGHYPEGYSLHTTGLWK